MKAIDYELQMYSVTFRDDICSYEAEQIEEFILLFHIVNILITTSTLLLNSQQWTTWA